MRILPIGIILALSGCKKRNQEPFVNTPTSSHPQQQEGLETESQLVSGGANHSPSQTGTQSLKGTTSEKTDKSATASKEETEDKEKAPEEQEEESTEDATSGDETEEETPEEESTEGTEEVDDDSSTKVITKKKPAALKRVVIVSPPDAETPEEESTEGTEDVDDDLSTKVITKKKSAAPKRVVIVSRPGRENRAPVERKPLEKNPAFFKSLAQKESPFEGSAKQMAVFDMTRGAVHPDDADLDEAVASLLKRQRRLLLKRTDLGRVADRRSAKLQKEIEERVADQGRRSDKEIVAAMTGELNEEIERIDKCVAIAEKIINQEDLSQEELETIVESCREIEDALLIDESVDEESADRSSLYAESEDSDDMELRNAEESINGFKV
jgi:hypothetical protein